MQPLSGQRVGCWFFQQVLEVWWFLILFVALGCGGFSARGCGSRLQKYSGSWMLYLKGIYCKHLLVGMPEGG